MKSLNLVRRLLGSLAVLSVLTVGVVALAPSQVFAIGGCNCIGIFQTVHGWGTASPSTPNTCAAAEANCLSSLASMKASTCEDGVCDSQNFRWTNACWLQSNGYWSRDCAEDVKCYVCLDEPEF